MAGFSNYEELKAAVADWLGRDDLSPRIPDFIALAEKRMARELRPRALERRLLLDVAAGQERVPLPGASGAGGSASGSASGGTSGAGGGAGTPGVSATSGSSLSGSSLSGSSASSGSASGIDETVAEVLSAAWLGPDGVRRALAWTPPEVWAQGRAAGRPHGWGVSGGELILVPAPAEAGLIVLHWRVLAAPLGPDNPDNEILLAAPELYLYGALVESAPYTRGWAPLEQWERFYSAARARLEAAEQRARRGSALFMRPARRL